MGICKTPSSFVEAATSTLNRELNSMRFEGHGLVALHHSPGAFTDFVAAFDVDAFEHRFLSLTPTKGNGEVWYLDDENHRSAAPSRERVCDSAILPLPRWAREVQFATLSRLFYPGAYGWSAVVFWATTGGATVGAHVDNEDVYTIQVLGSKLWKVDPPNPVRIRRLVERGDLARHNPSESWVLNAQRSIDFEAPVQIMMRPGDLLAMPAFALHEVATLTSGRNMAFNSSICQEQVWQNLEGH